MPRDAPDWRKYEEVATQLLNEMAAEFGLGHVEGKQIVPGASGTSWEIDGKGVKGGDGEAFVIIECKRHTTSKVEQDLIASLAYRILDTGAQSGIMVSPLGLQAGAAKVAAAANIVPVHMDENSTRSDCVMKWVDRAFIGVSDSVGITDEAHVEIVNDDAD